MSQFEYKTPTVIRFIQDYVSPLNVLYSIQVPLAALLDILSPYAPLLFIAVAMSLLSLVYHLITLKHHSEGNRKVKKSAWVIFSIFSLIIFSSSALANYKHRQDGGALANWIPTIKTWQDKYLVSIKQDTEQINAKLDRQNQMLQTFLASYRPQLEKPLIDEIPNYQKLPENQKQALLLFTSKVGVNNIKKYHGLMKAINNYTQNQTPENAKIVTNHFNYVVRVGGKNIEDQKTKLLLSALFLDPPTYQFLMADGTVPPPQNPWLLQAWGFDMSKPIDVQLADPLGDFIKELEAKKEDTTEEVVLPQAEKEVEQNAVNTATEPNTVENTNTDSQPTTPKKKIHTRQKVAGMF
jgi:hypothetical protein